MINNTFYCGIDPSLNSTGIVIFQNPSDVLVAETFSANNKQMGMSRFKGYDEGLNQLSDIFEHCVYPPESFFHVAVEAPSFGSKGKRAHHLAEWSGIVRNNIVNGWLTLPPEVIDNGTWKVYEIAPKALKKFHTDNGNANKELMAYHTKKKYDIDFGEEKGWSDKVDAHALACYAMDQHLHFDNSDKL